MGQEDLSWEKIMRRRSFLSVTGLANMAGIWKRMRQPQIGFLTADMYGAQGIDKITLDGREVPRVFELDDVEGWVRFYDPTGRVQRREGEIEVFWEDMDKIPIHWRDDLCRSSDVRRAARREANLGRLENASQAPEEEPKLQDRGEPSSDPKP